MKRVYVKGVFDVIHFGHIRFFEQAKKLGDFLVVGISPDSRASKMKRPPLFTCARRAEVVGAIKYIDQVIMNGPKIISINFMEKNKFDLYVFGAMNYEEKMIRLSECKSLPSHMIYELPYTREVSTSMILSNLKNSKN